MNKLGEAYELGVRTALREAGLIKEADDPGSAVWPALFGPLGGGLAAQEGKGWEAAGKTYLGGLGGTAVGGLGGAGLGALLASILSKGKIDPRAGALAGGVLGGTAGNVAGNVLGYRSATED